MAVHPVEPDFAPPAVKGTAQSSTRRTAYAVPPFAGARPIAFVLGVLIGLCIVWIIRQLDPWNEPDYTPVALVFLAILLCCCVEAWAQSRDPDVDAHLLLRVPYVMTMLFVYSIPIVILAKLALPPSEPPLSWSRAQELPLAAASSRTVMEERFKAEQRFKDSAPLAGIS
jgi:hypothetical protein